MTPGSTPKPPSGSNHRINHLVYPADPGSPTPIQQSDPDPAVRPVGLDSPSMTSLNASKNTAQKLIAQKRPLSEIEEIIFTHGSHHKVSAASASGYRQTGIPRHQPQPSSAMDMKAERRAFMSHKVPHYTQPHALICDSPHP